MMCNLFSHYYCSICLAKQHTHTHTHILICHAAHLNVFYHALKVQATSILQIVAISSHICIAHFFQDTIVVAWTIIITMTTLHPTRNYRDNTTSHT